MQVFFAEFCGRWGCSWQEGILTLFFMSLFKLGPFGTVLLIIFFIFCPILFICDIYEKIKYLTLPEELRKQQELESQKNTERIKIATQSANLLYKWRQSKKNNTSQQESQKQDISSTDQADRTKTRRWIGRAVKLVNKN